MDFKNKSFRSHAAYTSTLKDDLPLNPNLVEAKTKENFYKLLKWLYSKMSVGNQVGNKKA
ncbi:hypothetical protein [Helicobacter pylori]|uniref:hypothetical protein n=1 Tax=Helicobacter pylori TaxID=210 RepID=UPI00046DD9B9|nr:hypothetical protein [Helicobacter pylori]